MVSWSRQIPRLLFLVFTFGCGNETGLTPSDTPSDLPGEPPVGGGGGTPADPPLPPPPTPSANELLKSQIRLPPGFEIDIWAAGVTRPRSMVIGDDGWVFVGTYFFTKGLTSPIWALRDDDGDGIADRKLAVRNNFNTPNGLAYSDGTLYVVDEDRVFRIDDVEENISNPTIQLISRALPSRAETDQATNVGHWWRHMAIGPDDKLYVTVGTRWSFLVGAHTARDLDDDPIYSTIMRMDTDGGNLEMFADGVRNSMGLAFHPTTGDLWFTDNGPSWPFQDPRFYDIPADELNRAPAAGMHFGFPYIHASLDDPLIGSRAPTGIEFPKHEFAAHSAPLGLTFYTGTTFPERYRNQIFVAEHGTEATTPAPLSKVHGDRISMITIDDAGEVTNYEVFADGFRQGSNADYTRRPVDLLVLPDGSLLVSDDQSQMIYRIHYEG